MVKLNFVRGQNQILRPHTLGLLASLGGVAILSLNPLWIAGVIPGSDRIPPGLPEASHPLIVYLSIIGGSILVTWGLLTTQERNLSPLTPRRAALALIVALLGIVAGVALFVTQWLVATPTNLEGSSGGFDPSLFQIIQLELTAVHFVALAAVSTMFVGVVAANRGYRAAIVGLTVPTILLSLGAVWGPQSIITPQVYSVAPLISIPFTIGYFTTSNE